MRSTEISHEISRADDGCCAVDSSLSPWDLILKSDPNWPLSSGILRRPDLLMRVLVFVVKQAFY